MSSSENTSSNNDIIQPVSISFSLTPPHLARKSSASKLDYLCEVSYLLDDKKIVTDDLPLVNSYHAFVRPKQKMIRSIKKLISPLASNVKEYIQATKFSHFNLPATSHEQFVSLEIPDYLFPECRHEGPIHLHFGVVTLALTFHGRKGLPITARMTLLDSRF